MSIETTIKRLCEQWLELKTHFGIVMVSEKCYTSKVLYRLYKDDTLFLLSIFLKSVLRETQAVNKSLQAKQNDPTKLLNDLQSLLQSVAERIYIKEKIDEIVSEVDNLDKDFNEYLLPNPYLGYEFETNVKQKKQANEISDEQEKLIKNTCVNFTKALCTQ